MIVLKLFNFINLIFTDKYYLSFSSQIDHASSTTDKIDQAV